MEVAERPQLYFAKRDMMRIQLQSSICMWMCKQVRLTNLGYDATAVHHLSRLIAMLVSLKRCLLPRSA